MPLSKITSNSISTAETFQSFSTGGVERMRIDANGNIGIGTSTSAPTHMLTIGEDGGGNPANVSLGRGGLETSSIFFTRIGNNDAEITYDNSETLRIYNNFVGSPLLLGTNGVERMRITSVGDITLGTSSPIARMTIQGDTSYPYGGNMMRLSGNNLYTGMQIQNRSASASTDAYIYYDLLNENGAAIANFLGGALTDGSSVWTFSTQSAGTRTDRRIEKMRIDGPGRITMPYQPSFRVYRSDGSYTPGATTIVWNQVGHNTGGHYNTTNGRFTAPVSGTYVFMYQQYYRGTYTARGGFFVNGGSAGLHHIGRPSTAGEWTGISTLVIYLFANDYITCAQHTSYTGELFMAIDHSYFTGYLLG